MVGEGSAEANQAAEGDFRGEAAAIEDGVDSQGDRVGSALDRPE